MNSLRNNNRESRVGPTSGAKRTAVDHDVNESIRSLVDTPTVREMELAAKQKHSVSRERLSTARQHQAAEELVHVAAPPPRRDGLWARFKGWFHNSRIGKISGWDDPIGVVDTPCQQCVKRRAKERRAKKLAK